MPRGLIGDHLFCDQQEAGRYAQVADYTAKKKSWKRLLNG
jgi:hypothetical protein